MKRLALVLALLAPTLALAADNAIVWTPGSGGTSRSKDIGSLVQVPAVMLTDQTGTFAGAFANYGTSPGAVLVPAVNAFITNTPAGLATSALQPTVNAFAGTTSTGTTGPLMFGAVTTGAPTYTTGNNNPFSLDTAGNLRVNVVAGGGSGGTSSSFGAAFPGTGTAIGAKNGANMVNLTADGSGNLNVNVAAGSNVNGQATMANSSPVVMASNQSAFPVQTVTTNNANSLPHICGNTARVHVTTNTDTQILAQSGAANIYVCDYEFQLTGVGSFFLEKATSGTCATTTQIGQLWTGSANGPIGKAAGNAFYRGLNTGASSQLCVNTAALSSTTLDITVYYDQY
jgi:hypothetical protein